MITASRRQETFYHIHKKSASFFYKFFSGYKVMGLPQAHPVAMHTLRMIKATAFETEKAVARPPD
ncbi:hypothetical protein [Laceyella tengchongensis]|uniref:hypothetical protein n=1 Tax=Laceyella tengchongensis TaxID=574699 RepID=UPI0012B739AB|nr:hypothetical protein [Laceyella tengchongensis]